MGWCSATRIFDSVCDAVLNEEKTDPKEILMALVGELEGGDWDCQQDSAFWDNEIVQEIMKELHPDWFEDDE